MIASLRGSILEKHPNRIVVDVNGVGYEVFVPLSTFYGLGDPGSTIAVRIHTHVREDALLLYGFATLLEQELFERLIGVSGIGPKVALAVLSGIEPLDLIRAIERGDLARLTAIPGVGKKTAERMILELRDKLDLAGPPSKPAEAKSAFSATEEDVISALMNFGATRAAAEAAAMKARSASESNDFDGLYRRAVKLVR